MPRDVSHARRCLGDRSVHRDPLMRKGYEWKHLIQQRESFGMTVPTREENGKIMRQVRKANVMHGVVAQGKPRVSFASFEGSSGNLD